MVKQFDVYWVNLDPTIGSEIKKKRPCVVVSPKEMNTHLRTVIIAPITSTINPMPMRVPVKIKDREGMILLDQIRCVDKRRLDSKIKSLPKSTYQEIQSKLIQMFS